MTADGDFWEGVPRCERTRPAAVRSGEAGGTNFKVTSFWEAPLSKAISGCEAGGETVRSSAGGKRYNTEQDISDSPRNVFNKDRDQFCPTAQHSTEFKDEVLASSGLDKSFLSLAG